MKRITLGTLALLALVVSFCAVRTPQIACAQQTKKPVKVDAPTKGSFRVKILDIDDTPAQKIPQTLFLLYQKGEPIWENWQSIRVYSEGEYLTVNNLKPGIYDLHIAPARDRAAGGSPPFCPIHIYSIVIKASQRPV